MTDHYTLYRHNQTRELVRVEAARPGQPGTLRLTHANGRAYEVSSAFWGNHLQHAYTPVPRHGSTPREELDPR